MKTQFRGQNFKGNNRFYLGINKFGEKTFLVKPSWDCGWYWGCGYLSTISSHSHWSGLSDGKNMNSFDAFNEEFQTTPLTEGQLWMLCDYLSSMYVLKDFASTIGRG